MSKISICQKFLYVKIPIWQKFLYGDFDMVIFKSELAKGKPKISRRENDVNVF